LPSGYRHDYPDGDYRKSDFRLCGRVVTFKPIHFDTPLYLTIFWINAKRWAFHCFLCKETGRALHSICYFAT
jgi:hypothetical protein